MAAWKKFKMPIASAHVVLESFKVGRFEKFGFDKYSLLIL
ncbi:MAG: crotonobetainyl-CoA:carnitine CoA-transferase CaiB-like acyl-CoA transferase, partial [Octadecabacter sp.]